MLSGIHVEPSSTPLIRIGLKDTLGTRLPCLLSLRTFLKPDQGQISNSIDVSFNPRISIHASISISYTADHLLELPVHASGRGYPQPFPWTASFLVHVVSGRKYGSKG
jgi:hypothetical protein